MKTHKAAAKRVWKTSTKKIMHRKAGQDHFNARESGKVTRNKRQDQTLSHRMNRTVGRMLLS